jgi:hypothetical protein
MKKETHRLQQPDQKGPVETPAESKKEWQEPKLNFIKPKLTRHGTLEEVTGQFFGAFTPTPG